MTNPRRHIEIRRRLFQNSALMAASRMLLIAASLACVPMIIKAVGWEGYGAWEAIMALSGFSAILIGPLSGTLMWRIANTSESHEIDYAFRLMGIGIFFSLLLFVAFFPLVWFFRFELMKLLNIPSPLFSTASWILPAMVGITLLGGINESMAALLNGYQKSGVVSLIQMIATLLQYGFIIVALCLGGGFESLLLGTCGSILFSAVLFYWRISRLGCNPNFSPVIPQKADFHAMALYFALLSVGMLSSLMREQCDKLLLAGFGTTIALVGYYGIASRLANIMIQFFNFFSIPMISAVGVFHAANDWANVKRLYSNVTKMVLFFAGAIVVLILGLYDRLMVIWLGRNVPEVLPLLIMLIISNFLVLAVAGPGSSLCRGIGRVSIETKYVLVNLVLNVVLTVILVWAWGAIGTVIASAISWSISALFFNYLLNRALDLDRSNIFYFIGSSFIILICVIAARTTSGLMPFPISRVPAVFYASLVCLPVMSIYVLAMIVFKILPIEKVWILLNVLRRKENG